LSYFGCLESGIRVSGCLFLLAVMVKQHFPSFLQRCSHILLYLRVTQAFQNLKFDFNTQHDCFSAKCEATGVRAVMQERVESDKSEHFIVHAPLDHFIVNMDSFHNPHLVRATISRDLWAPVPLFENRKAKHDEFSAQLRETRATKAAKRKETAARKRAYPTAAASNNNDEPQQRPRKRARITQAAPRARAPRGRTSGSVTRVAPVSTGSGQTIGLATGRSRRTIMQSTRAKEADQSAHRGEDSSSSEEEDSEDSESDETEYNSGDDFIESR
jgi:hypothetical protein